MLSYTCYLPKFNHGGTFMNEQQVADTRVYADLETIKPYWSGLVATAVLLMIAGAFAISYASTTNLITIMILGILLIVSGSFHLISAIFTRGTKSFFITIFTALINLVFGLWIIYDPVTAAVALTLIMAAFLVLSGIIRIITAIVYRKEINWLVVFFSGLISLMLGVVIYAQWPVSGLWVIGLFVGVEIFFAGWALFALGLAARSTKE